VETERPDDLADIAQLGLTLPEAKRLLADLQQKNLAAQVQGPRRTEVPAKQWSNPQIATAPDPKTCGGPATEPRPVRVSDSLTRRTHVARTGGPKQPRRLYHPYVTSASPDCNGVSGIGVPHTRDLAAALETDHVRSGCDVNDGMSKWRHKHAALARQSWHSDSAVGPRSG
jgi:hypothetical protein